MKQKKITPQEVMNRIWNLVADMSEARFTGKSIFSAFSAGQVLALSHSVDLSADEAKDILLKEYMNAVDAVPEMLEEVKLKRAQP